MRISRLLGAATLAAVVAVAGGAQGALAQQRGQGCSVRFVSPQVALEQGIGAYQSGFYSIALPALTCAAESGEFLAQYFLARLYADSNSTMTDHRRAYQLFRAIVDEHAATIDVDDDARASYVGKALAAYAGYWLRGLPEVGLAPNPEQAAFFLQQAATFFRDPDAQFELAKLYLKGEGVPEDRRKALGWLTILTQEAHPGAQAFFAELLWRGKVVPRDERRALALITVAVENAPANERLWIEDTYQTIYCGISPSVRKQADGLIASFRHNYAPRVVGQGDRQGLGLSATRTCESGEVVNVPYREGRAGDGGRGTGGSDDGVMGVRERSR